MPTKKLYCKDGFIAASASCVPLICIFWGEPLLVQELSRQTMSIADHLLEILRVRIVSQYELGLLLQVNWHVCS